MAAPSRDATTAFSYTLRLNAGVATVAVALPGNDARHKVNGVQRIPRFGTATAHNLVYTPGQLILVSDLPAATGGNGALTYSLNQTTNAPPCGTASGASGSNGVAGASESGNAIPDWMRYYAPGAAYNGITVDHDSGGKIAPHGAAKPETKMSPTCFELYASDADGDNSATDRAVLSFSVTVLADYDRDDNGLPEVSSLAQLDAIRYDLNGDGDADNTADDAKYAAAFPNPTAGMGCQLVDHDNNASTAKTPVCSGYELTSNLDFDTDDDGATYTVSSTGAITGDAGDTYYNGGQGWTPIGGAYTATFDGKGNTISNLFINQTDTQNLGLFSIIAGSGTVQNLGLPNVRVTRTSNGGVTGSLVGDNQGTVANCYATGTVATVSSTGSGLFTTGGLSGYLRRGGAIRNSYAAVAVSGAGVTTAAGRSRIGGLVGRAASAGSSILASYATGSVAGGDYGRAGGLVGTISNGVYASAITASYATGIVAAGANGPAGGLTGLRSDGAVANSYYRDHGSVGLTDRAAGIDKAIRDLQSPTGYAGIYANQNVDVDNADGDNNPATGVDDPWDFGASRQYPVLKHGVLYPKNQRQVSIQSDHWNTPVVGEPVTAALNVTGATSITWQWQSSATGATWTNIANATAATYIPVAADAARGGKFLRAQVTFTASGKTQTLVTANTAKVVSAPSATAAGVTSIFPIVGQRIRHRLSATGAAKPGVWRWQRCDDALMTTNCQFLNSSEPADNAHTEYTPAAGTDTDVGKYRQAYAYYSNGGNGNVWMRTQTSILGPVVAAAPAPVSPSLSPSPSPSPSP